MDVDRWAVTRWGLGLLFSDLPLPCVLMVKLSGGYPLPLWGYFGRKFMVFNGLRGVRLCKRFILNGLRLKSSPD
jgi:hypothetical protein